MADIKSQPNDSTEVSLRKAVDLLGNIEDKTNTLVVGELEVKNTSGDPLAVQGTVNISSGSIADLDISEQVRSGVFNWADSELVGNVQAGLGVRNASEFESGISLIRAANFPPDFTNFNGFYRLNYINRASNSDGLYANYLHCNAADFQEFTPSLKLERVSGQWAWFFRAEENVCIKYISAPANGSYVSPAGLNAFEPGDLGGGFTSVYVVRADAIPTTNPAIGNTHDMPALDATVDLGAHGSSLISLGKGIFQKLKLVPGIGATNETPAAFDTATSGINGLLKRLLQRITTLIYPPYSSGSFDNTGATSSAIDCAGYDYLVQHVSGGGGGYTRPVQWSNDGTNWTSSSPAVGTYFYYSSNSGWETLQGNMGTNSGLFVFPVLGRYWRITSGGGGGGSWTHRWYLHKGPFPGILEDSLGSKISSAASSDTDNTGLIGLFKRLLQRITTLVPANLTVTSTRLLVDGSGVTQPVSGTVTAAQATAANLNATVVGSGSFTAAQATAANLNATVVQGTATNLKTQSEVYQGGTAVGSASPLQVTLANTGSNATAVNIAPRNGAVTVTTGATSGTANTSAQALPQNTSRKYLLIQNISDTDMYFNFGAAATTSNLLVAKSGGGIVFESGFVPTDAVNVICSAATKSYYILSA